MRGRMSGPARFATGAAALALLALTPALAQSPELWVVNRGSRHVTIINPDSEAVVDTVDLADIPAEPYCVAFSTFSGEVSNYAFVSQGPFIRVIDTDARAVIKTVDVGSHLGLPIRMKGCASARPRDFTDAGVPAVRHYLHVAAEVEVGAQQWQPWFAVLDQVVLALGPLGTDPLAGRAGPLVPLPAGVEREAMEVVVLAAPSGPLFQRAWYSVRELSPIPTVFASLVAAPQDLAQPFLVHEVRTAPAPPGSTVPDSLGLAAPFSRELAGLAEGPSGRLVNLDGEGFCDVGTLPRSVAIAGVGPGSYTVLVADKVNDGVNGRVHLLDGLTCAVEDTADTQLDPTDIVTLGPIDWRKAFVANRGSDSVTVIRDDFTTVNIPIPPIVDGGELSIPTTLSCTTCPQSMSMGVTSETACTIQNLTVGVAANGLDVDLAWDTVDCDSGTWFEIWCVCEPGATNCPVECRSGTDPCTPGSFENCTSPSVADGGWEPLGLTINDYYLHIDAASSEGVSYTIEPDDNQPP